MLLELVEDGMLGKDDVIMACVKYMSEDDVKDMMQCNEFIEPEEDEPEEDEPDVDEATEWADFDPDC
jgi:hypothetical protein